MKRDPGAIHDSAGMLMSSTQPLPETIRVSTADTPKGDTHPKNTFIIPPVNPMELFTMTIRAILIINDLLFHPGTAEYPCHDQQNDDDCNDVDHILDRVHGKTAPI
jgi:hypothetical protein